MTQDTEIIKSNLEKYPLIKHFLGDIIDQRLKIECYTHGMLTASLLVLEELKESDLQAVESTKSNLERLETVLQFGNSCCENFELIFQEDKLSQYQDADSKIIDMLAEVKAFEFLCRHGFKDTTKIRHKPDAKTVDFIARRDKQNYAIEVTRLGLSESEKKQPVYDYKVSTLDYSAKCEDADGFEVSMIDGELNKERIEREINDAIQHKYSQIKEFCEVRAGALKGILFISSGRDYFIMRRYENKGYEQTPRTDFLKAPQQVWQSLKGEQKDKYLHHLVITRGKDLGKAVISPSF